jgi:hypothetical protein
VVHQPGEQAPFTAIAAQLGSIEARGLCNTMNVSAAPQPLGIFGAGRDEVTLQAPSLAPLLESDHVNTQLLGDCSHALAMESPIRHLTSAMTDSLQ